MCSSFVVDVVPRHHVAPSTGGGAAHGEDQLLVEGSLQEVQDLPSLWAVGEEGRTGGSLVPLSWTWVLLLKDNSRQRQHP